MENSRVVRTKRSFYGTRSSPYERPSPRPSSAGAADEGQHKSGLFSRVVGFFRPQKSDTESQSAEQHTRGSQSPQNRPYTALYPVIDRSQIVEDTEPEIVEEQVTQTVYTPPRAHKRISLGPNPGKSPNQRLAEFFEKKGDTPLSDVETAGVLALINEAASDDPGLAQRLSPSSTSFDRSVRHSMSLASLAGRNETYQSPSKIPRRVGPESNTGLKKSRSMASLGNRGHGARVARSSLGGIRGRPSPMSPRVKPNGGDVSRYDISQRRDSGDSKDSKNDSRRSSNDSKNGSFLSPTKPLLSSTPQPASPSSPSLNRPLSGVASTLLSLIDDDEEEVLSSTPDPAPKEFINPYASSPRRPERETRPAVSRDTSREKLMTPSPEKKESPSKTPSQIISQSMPLEQQRERDSVKAQPQMKKFDKYKPVRSSNLRDSFVADPKSPENTAKQPSKEKISFGSPDSMPPAFTFGSKPSSGSGFTSKLKSASPSTDEDTDVKIGKDLASSAAIRSPSKPLYPEISKDKPLLPSTPKLAKAGIPSTPQSEAAKKFARDFDFSTPLKGETLKPLTPADKSKVDQFKRDFVF